MSSSAQKKEFEVVREGDKIILPDRKRMNWDVAIQTMKMMQNAEEQWIDVDEEIDAYPLEGAYALSKVIDQKYGWKNLKNPYMIAIEVAPGQMEQVPWGRFEIPGVEGHMQTGFSVKEGRFIFKLMAKVKGKFREEVAEIAANVRQHISDHSIYKGKAIRVTFPNPDDDDFSPVHSPKFMDVSSVNPDCLVFSKDIESALKIDLFWPIKHSTKFREQGMSLKRAVLLAGPYGTGKTLTAYVAAKLAVDAGSTFLYLTEAKDLPRAIHFARNYGRVVIFAEDVDSVMESRDSEMEAAFDGFETKNSEVHVIGTTNHLEKVSPAMRRQGRFDNILNILPPDTNAVERLIRMYAKGKLDAKEDISFVANRLSGQIPAAIHETVKRALIFTTGQSIETGKSTSLTAEILNDAAGSVLRHIELTAGAKIDERPAIERAAAILGRFISNGMDRMEDDELAQKALNNAPMPPASPNGKKTARA